MDTPETDRTVDESTPATQAVGDVNTGVAETKSEPAAVSKQSKEKSKRKSKKRRAQSNRKRKAKKKPKKQETDSDSSDSSDDDSSDSTSDRKPKRRGKKRSSRRTDDEEVEDESDGSQGGADDQLASMRRQLSALQMQLMMTPGGRAAGGRSRGGRGLGRAGRHTIHNYKLQESAEDQEDEFDEYIFTVRRRFDWENKYKHTVVDIKSKLLRECLQEIMKDVRGISLVEDKPSIDPNMLFLYLEELRTYTKKTLKAKSKSEKKRRNRRKIKNQIAHCKVMLKYLDEDYKETKKTLYPMLEAGNITFDLLWALFKPDTIAYTPTYGSVENPRCFKVDYANKESSFMRGEWYCIEGRYLEYDGKSYGLGDFEVDVDAFKGARKITSLATYPLKYHQDPEAVRTQLIERGKRFVSMEGMNYRFHHGLAFVKKKKTVAKVNINGRIMIDPATFRRINPNYPISIIKPKETDNLILPRCDSDTDDDGCSCRSGDESDGGGGDEALGSREDQQRMGFKVVEDPDRPDHYVVVEVPIDEEAKDATSASASTPASTTSADASKSIDASKPTAEDKPTNDNKPAAAPLPPAFSEADYDALARRALNGRQIKNSVRTAQALAVNEGARMGMEHVRRVLDVAESFERDLKGGSGYDDAMRSYT
ncbi:hypothetical protein FH972_021351 [Carpinus fangiana]|uniref:DUF7025 domain-containing protein n=1 Tax=Carpinus fangiana TaxID=176857 RepID=A0A5N6KR96_9ROSI|nr:hypothetical protein FH972_021351 [Carpinus fangiana]